MIIVMMFGESIYPHTFHTCSEGLYCSRIHCLGVNSRVYITVKLIYSLTGVAVLP